MLFVSIKDREIGYIDSLEGVDEVEKTEKARKNWTKFCKTINISKKTCWRTHSKYTKHGYQNDKVSCGAFVCYFAEMLIRSKMEKFHASNVNINEYRAAIASNFGSPK